jgi:hypothetical protein
MGEEPLRLAALDTSPRGRGEGPEFGGVGFEAVCLRRVVVAFLAVSWRGAARLGLSWAARVELSTMSRNAARDWVLRFELMVCWRVVLMRSMAAVAFL